MNLKWHPPVGDPTKIGMCRHYNDPATCRACQIHDDEMRRITGLPVQKEKR